MDPRKLAFSEQILSPKRKVIPRFGLSIAVSLFVLSLLFLYYSSPGKSFFPFSNRSTNAYSPLAFWSFPFSSPSLFNMTSNSSNLDNATEITLQANRSRNIEPVVNGSQKIGDERFQLNTHAPNKSEIGNVSLSVESQNTTTNGKLPSQQKLNGDEKIQEKFPSNSTSLNNNITEHQGKNNHSSGVGEDKRAFEGNGGEKSTKEIGITNDTQPTNSSISFYGECDIFDGRWERDNSKPFYPPGSCSYIDRDFDCHINKRPDDEYVRWKWQPNGCDIPTMNATHFLEIMRGKSLVFVGDSLNRNMWESMVCILRHSISDKKRVYEISGRTEFKKGGFYSFRFEDYNCSVDFVSSPFLVKESSFKRKNGTIETLRLDEMDPTTTMYRDADVMVFNTGHWWTHEKTSKGENYYQEGNYVHPKLTVLEAFERALTTWGRWIDNNVDRNRTLVLFRGYSYSHFSGGQWNSGGQCHKEMEPIYNETHLGKYPRKMRALEHVMNEMKTPVMYLNITRLTHYRKDAHPSIYRMEYKTEAARRAAVRAQDCSHWCLPGVPDTWNELLYVSILKRMWGK